MLLLLGSVGVSIAQTFSATFIPSDLANDTEAALMLSGLKTGGLLLDVRVAGSSGGAFEFGVGLVSNTPFGPIGNLTLSGRADADTEGRFDLSLQGRGTAGPVAARLRLDAFNALPGRFEPARLVESERPFVGEDAGDAGVFGVWLGAGVSYRLERTLILDLESGGVWLAGEGFGGRLSAELQLRSLVERDDGAVLLAAYLAPGGANYAATGFEYRLNRRDAPLVRGALLLGVGPGGVAPGLRMTLLETSSETHFELVAGLEPYRTDAPPLRIRAGLTRDLSTSAWTVEGIGAHDLRDDAPVLALVTGYGWRF